MQLAQTAASAGPVNGLDRSPATATWGWAPVEADGDIRALRRGLVASGVSRWGGGVGAVVSWWVVDATVGSDLERALDAAVPAWLASEWSLEDVRFGV